MSISVLTMPFPTRLESMIYDLRPVCIPCTPRRRSPAWTYENHYNSYSMNRRISGVQLTWYAPWMIYDRLTTWKLLTHLCSSAYHWALLLCWINNTTGSYSRDAAKPFTYKWILCHNKMSHCSSISVFAFGVLSYSIVYTFPLMTPLTSWIWLPCINLLSL